MNTSKLVYVAILVSILFVLVSNYSLNYFGVPLGSVKIMGQNLEHEYAGLGLLASVPFFIDRVDKKWLLIVGAAAVFFIISDAVSFLNPPTSWYGAAISVVLGFVIGFSVLKIAEPEVTAQ